jgi:multiple sugar transport system ATP-binding protein
MTMGQHRIAVLNGGRLQQLVTCRLLEGSHLVLVRATPEQSVTVGQAVHLKIDPGGWRLFEGKGVALPRPKPPGEKPLELPQFQA